RLQIRETEHQVRTKVEDPLEVRVEERAHPRLAASLGRAHHEARDAHNPLSRPEQVERFHRLLGQTHHPPRPGWCLGQELFERHGTEAARESPRGRAPRPTGCRVGAGPGRIPRLRPRALSRRTTRGSARWRWWAEPLAGGNRTRSWSRRV